MMTRSAAGWDLAHPTNAKTATIARGKNGCQSRVLPASCRQRNLGEALPTRRRQHLVVGTVRLARRSWSPCMLLKRKGAFHEPSEAPSGFGPSPVALGQWRRAESATGLARSKTLPRDPQVHDLEFFISPPADSSRRRCLSCSATGSAPAQPCSWQPCWLTSTPAQQPAAPTPFASICSSGSRSLLDA